MSVPRKGAKRLNHRDTQYLWFMQIRNGISEVMIEMSAAVEGEVLIAQLPRILTSTMIGEAIDFGLKNGWKPGQSGPVFRCKYDRKAFVKIEG